MTESSCPPVSSSIKTGTSWPDDWRNQLAQRLGQRPRRIGVWAELALFGALQGLDSIGVSCLSPHTVLRVASSYGAAEALAHAWEACADEALPMPFDFLQSQPSQMLAALSHYLQWQGDASFIAHEDPERLLTCVQTEANTLRQQALQHHLPWGGTLFGYIDLTPVPGSRWLFIE